MTDDDHPHLQGESDQRKCPPTHLLPPRDAQSHFSFPLPCSPGHLDKFQSPDSWKFQDAVEGTPILSCCRCPEAQLQRAVSSAHTQRVLTRPRRMHRLVTRQAPRLHRVRAGQCPQSDKRASRGKDSRPTAESRMCVPGGPAEEATGSNAAKSSNAAQGSGRGDAPASGAIGSPGCAGTERGWPAGSGPE